MEKRTDKPDMGAIATGSILGGMALGPLGIPLGAAIGDALSSSKKKEAEDKNKAAELGFDPRAYNDVVEALDNAKKAYAMNLNLLEDRLRDMEQMKTQMANLYALAGTYMQDNNEQGARAKLEERLKLKLKLEKWMQEAEQDRSRIQALERQCSILEERLVEFKRLASRTAAANAMIATSRVLGSENEMTDSSFRSLDPIEERFRKLEEGEQR